MYIQDTQNDGEKVLYKWPAGCLSENYSHAMIEIEETQALNKRAKSSKTYHLIISLRPEDEDKLNEAVFKDIEASFAKSLGFEDHQRVCGVHKNTENIHMHIAYNKIHPEKHTSHSPSHDYLKRDALCRELEQKYGLTVDEGIDLQKDTQPANRQAKTMEAHTGLESFDTYVKRHKPELMEALVQSSSWNDLHKAITAYGLCIKPYGNGMVIKNRHGKQQIKASAFDRDFGKARLEAKLGAFEAATPEDEKHFTEQSRYVAHPLQPESPEQNVLFQEYSVKIEQRKNRLTTIKADTDGKIANIKERWREHRQELVLQPMRSKDRNRLLKLSRIEEKQELADLRTKAFIDKEHVRAELPFASWLGFLQHKAQTRLANESALEILRSKNKYVLLMPDTAYMQARKADEAIKAKFRGKQIALTQSNHISAKNRKAAGTLLQIEEFKALYPTVMPDDFKISIGKKGAVIIHLPTGGYIRDIGRALQYSLFDAEAQKMALLLAKHKWGNHTISNKNNFAPDFSNNRKIER